MRAAALFLALTASAGAALAQTDIQVHPGAGQVVFDDVPVTPGSYPATTPHVYAVKAKTRVHSRSFDYDTGASPWNVLAWYRSRLPKAGWRIEGIRPNFPARGAVSIIANKRGEAVTIVIEGAASPSQVTLVKVDSLK
ncbi:MAG: hypothetical protein NVS9B12_13700 [Vulcanimicrobiaceae bacterium]